jgi:multisubunit Na+/H+ antiporter MnhB subunit
MSFTDWTLLVLFICGFLLILVGANVYNSIVGFSGVVLFLGSIIAYVVIYVYKEIAKRQNA